MRKKYDWCKDVGSIKAPTMLVFADADAIRPEHMVEFFRLLGGGSKDGGLDGAGIPNARLAILPGLTHYNIFSSPALVPTVTPFLDAPMPKPDQKKRLDVENRGNAPTTGKGRRSNSG